MPTPNNPPTPRERVGCVHWHSAGPYKPAELEGGETLIIASDVGNPGFKVFPYAGGGGPRGDAEGGSFGPA